MLQGSRQAGNPDGWGVAYFTGADATLFREPAPAAQSAMVRFLSGHAPRSDLIISQVRRATYGERKLANTQPFQRVLGGHSHVFAHNGFVPPADAFSPSPWLIPQGSTDSEQLFCHLLGYLEPLWSRGGIPSLESRLDVVERFAHETLERGAANFLYSDGINLFAHGHRQTLPGEAVSDAPGLYVKLYQSETGSDMTVPCRGLRSQGGCSDQALVATMPLNEDEWAPLKAGEIACFERGRRLH